MVEGGQAKGCKSRKDKVGYDRKLEGGEMVEKGGVEMDRKVRERERGKIKAFELNPTIRTEVMVKSDFLTFTYISAKL